MAGKAPCTSHAVAYDNHSPRQLPTRSPHDFTARWRIYWRICFKMPAKDVCLGDLENRFGPTHASKVSARKTDHDAHVL
jgi:hypothetical protein